MNSYLRELTIRNKRPLNKSIVCPLGILQLVLFTVALLSILKKSAAAKDKVTWILISLVNFIGPVIYFIFGSKKLDEKGNRCTE